MTFASVALAVKIQQNYYVQAKTLGYSEFLQNNMSSLDNLYKVSAISYYHIIERFDLSKSIKLNDSILSMITMPNEDKKKLASGFNILGVAHRITGNLITAIRYMNKSVRLYKKYANKSEGTRKRIYLDSVEIVRANVSRAHKLLLDFKKCESILDRGYSYAMKFEIPDRYNSDYVSILHLHNGPTALYIEYCLDTLKTEKAREIISIFDKLYSINQTHLDRYYLRYLAQKALLELIDGNLEKCKEILSGKEYNSVQYENALQVKIMAYIYEYNHCNKNTDLLNEVRNDCITILSKISKGHKWERYAEIFPLLKYVNELLGVQSTINPDFPAAKFRKWLSYKESWYRKILY